jgi:hypothetical protein
MAEAQITLNPLAFTIRATMSNGFGHLLKKNRRHMGAI